MRNLHLLFVISLFSLHVQAQELNAQVIINADLVNQTNQQVFKTLERSLNEFINTRSWTSVEFLPQEKITCSFVINLTSYNASKFEGTLQVQSQRPIFDSNFDSPILNFLDKDISFNYEEFQPLFYNPSAFESNIVALISFYIYTILGLDADTFKFKGGSSYFEQAQKIVNLSQLSGQKGWKQNESVRNRFWLIDTMRSNTFKEYRETMYAYHRKGMDVMTQSPEKGKKEMMLALSGLEKLFMRRPNALLLQLFFDAKSDEIVNVFSSGPEVEFDQTAALLKKTAPFFLPKWKQIK